MLVAALIGTTVMALVPHEPKALDQVLDRYQHMAAFGLLAVLASIGFRQASLFRLGERLSFLGALIEIAQSIPELHRDCDIFDWIADSVAIVVVLCIVGLVRNHLLSVPAQLEFEAVG
ncbi:MAG: hypothetical protein K2Y20_09670 [Sphingomonas sp.]|nr:hypothetical protein [Sphingomonas sp.]